MKKSHLFQFLKSTICFLAAFMLLYNINARAQTAASYSFSASSGTYTAISSTATATSLSTTSDEGISSAFTFPSGFSFSFCGIAYTSARVSTNGYLVFGASGSSTATNNLASTTTTLRPLLAPLWDDLQCKAGVKYELSGSSPSRVLTIEWKEMEWNNTSGTAVISFQIKLFETSNVIQFVYKEESTAYASGSGGASIGIKGGTISTDFISLSSSGASPSTSTSTSTNNIGSKPSSGQIYQFTPPPPTCTTPSPGATLATTNPLPCLGNSTTLSIASLPTGTGNTFQWQSSIDNITYTNITGAKSSTLVVSPVTPTWYRCNVTCSNGPVTIASSPLQITFSNAAPSVTPNVRCGIGTVNLAASASAGATLKWYTLPSGGAAIGTGSTFTTPTISTTSSYYVGAETYPPGSGAIGSGTATTSGSGSSPFSQSWESNRSQYLILASDLSAAGFVSGDLTSMSIPVTSKFSSLAFSSYTIKLAHTTISSLTTGTYLTPSFSTVYGPTSYTSVAGANNFSFGTAFNWDGTSNVVVDICFDNDPTGTGGDLFSPDDVIAATTKSYTAVVGRYADNSAFCGTTTGGTFVSATALPNFSFNGLKVCSSPRVIVTATVNAPPSFSISGTQTVCNNAVATMNVSSSLSSFNTYTWSPATGLFTDAACTTGYTTGTSASTVYYKSTAAGQTKYTCTANNATTLCAATDTAWITNLPTSITTLATPANMCFSGNAKMTFTPSMGLGAAQLQWQSSPDNSTWTDSTGMTGTSLTTATLSNTRYYRVVLKNSAGAFCLNSSSDTALVHKPSVVSTTGASRCGSGSVTLSATVGAEGVLYWYDVATGGLPTASGATFTTPSLPIGTTTYYVASESVVIGNASVGSGTTSSNGSSGQTPFSLFYTSAHSQYLVMASDLRLAGLRAGSMTSLAFNVVSKSSNKPYSNYAIKMANTSATSLTSGFAGSTLTTVYGPLSYTSIVGNNNFNFSTPFNWDGTSNLLVDVCFDNVTPALGFSSNDAASFASTSYTATYGAFNDFTNLCGSTGGSTTSTNALPVMSINGNVVCGSSPRSAVVATVNPLPIPTVAPATGPIQICDGNTTTLTGRGGGTYQWKNASGLISGATDSVYTTGTTGTYRVVVTNPTTGCKDSTAFVGVNVNPTPTVSIAPVGTTQICADSSQKFTSVVSGLGLTYQWFKSGVAIAGATKDSLRANTSGIYTMRVYLGTCSDTSNDGNLIVNPLPASSFTKTGTTGAICLGSTFELTALSVPATSSYQWSLNGVEIPGATSKNFNASLGGIYTVRIRDANNCRKTSDTASLINTPMGIPNPSPKEARFCEGTILKLYSNAGPYAAKFAWTRNGVTLPDTTAQILSANNGTYEVTVTDVYGCILLSTKSTLSVDPLPVKPIITKSGAILSTAAPYYTYQWFRNGKAIPGATLRNYTMMFDGKYHVEVTNSYNCMNVSDVLSIQGLSVKQITREDVNVDVYPNPTQNMINIAAPIEVNVMIQDVQGKKVMELKNAKQVDMSTYADGIYIFTITDKEGLVLKMDKVVKRTN